VKSNPFLIVRDCYAEDVLVAKYCKIEKENIVSNLLRFITIIHNMDTFEANWVLELNPALDPSLHLRSSNSELSFCNSFIYLFIYLGLNQLIFPPKRCDDIGLAWICHSWVLDPRLKALGPIYGSHPIGLLYFSGPWTLDPHLKWPQKFLLNHPWKSGKTNVF